MSLHILRTLMISALGVGLFLMVGLPLPWLLGPMFACLAAAFLGVDLKAPSTLCSSMRTILGVAVGASITPAVVTRLPDMAASIALIPPFVLMIGLIGYPYFRKLWGYDPATSYYAAMPGGLVDMLIFGEEAGGSARILSLVHATRVLVIVSLLPLFLTEVFNLDLSNPPGAPIGDVPYMQLAIMAVVAIAGWRLAVAVGLFGASVLGPMILATIASLTGLIDQRPPAEAMMAAQFFIGLTVGVRYVGLTVTELRTYVLSGLGFTLILAALSVLFMEIVILLGLSDPVDAILAFAPGGQGEMTVIALIAGADVAYVVTHHLTRIVTVIVGAPLVGRWLR